MKAIIITGTPGTGKTVLAKDLAEKLSYSCVDVNKIIAKYHISEGYDEKRKTKIIDTKKLSKSLIKEISSLKKTKVEGIIIDSHLSHYLPKKYADLCIVTKCDLKTLKKRLKKKKYHKDKIRENLDAEIFDVCLEEAKQGGHKITIIDTTKGIQINRVIKKLNL